MILQHLCHLSTPLKVKKGAFGVPYDRQMEFSVNHQIIKMHFVSNRFAVKLKKTKTKFWPLIITDEDGLKAAKRESVLLLVPKFLFWNEIAEKLCFDEPT